MASKTGPKSLLSAADVVQVKNLAAQGRSDNQIAAELHVSRSTVLRARRSPGPPGEASHVNAGEALSEYKQLVNDAFHRATRGEAVSEDIAYIKLAEETLFENGITRDDGRQLYDSLLVEIAQRAASIRKTSVSR